MHLRIHLRGPTGDDNHSIGLLYIQCLQKISCTSASRRKDCLCQVPVGKVDFSFVHSLRCWPGIHKLASISSSVILRCAHNLSSGAVIATNSIIKSEGSRSIVPL